MMADGPEDHTRAISLEEALTRLAEAEQQAALLEARLRQYQAALESIHIEARKALES
ncbi:MAG: hypothetical protein WAT66_00690 [Actinomycetota bacterium]